MHSKIVIFFDLLLLFVMALFVGTYSNLKLFVLLLTASISFTYLWSKRIYLYRDYLLGTLLFVFVSLLYIILTAVRKYPVRLELIEIYIVRPVILFIIASTVDSREKIYMLTKGIIVITLFIILSNILFALGSLNLIPQTIFWEEGYGVVYDAFIFFRLNNQVALMFLYPLCIILNFRAKEYGKLWRIILRGILVAGLFVSLLSGRRALQLIVCMLFVCIIVISLFNSCKKDAYSLVRRLFLLSFIIILGLGALYGIQAVLSLDNIVLTILNTIRRGFEEFGSETGPRSIQIHYLKNAFLKNPFIGRGLGGFVREYVREGDSYEAVYYAYLMKYGIIGMAIQLCFVFRIYKKIYAMYRMNRDSKLGCIYLSVLVGGICFMVAGSTNPMITSTWAWMITLIFYNSCCKGCREQ